MNKPKVSKIKPGKEVNDEKLEVLHSPFDRGKNIIMDKIGDGFSGWCQEIKKIEPGPNVKKPTLLMVCRNKSGEMANLWLRTDLLWFFGSAIPNKTYFNVVFSEERQVKGRKIPQKIFKISTNGEIKNQADTQKWIKEFIDWRDSFGIRRKRNV